MPKTYSLGNPFQLSDTLGRFQEKAEVNLEYSTEIQDIVDELVRLEVIEVL
jgi:hypothetical protein